MIEDDQFTAARKTMVDFQLRGRGITDERVLAAMAAVPRHEFVDPGHWNEAYEDHPIPIAEGQTVSQPYIVAVTLAALSLQQTDVVLEIGTGSGYQTAVLASLVRQVYSVERLAGLAQKAKSVLTQLGYTNIIVEVGDGTLGLPAFAPYDAIVVSAGAPRVPPALLEQLRDGGRMMIPVGGADAQALLMVRKEDGAPIMTQLEGCRFVPLIGEQGYAAK